METRDSPTDFPVRQVSGIKELFWMARNWWWRAQSKRWTLVIAKVENREFLRFATNAGWFALLYSYSIGQETFSGELRQGMISRKTSTAASDPDTIALSWRFPPESQIQIRVDPSRPDRSVVCEKEGLVRAV